MLSAAFLNLIMRLTVLGQQGSGEEQTQQEYPTQTLWNSQCFTAHNNIPAMTNQGLQFKSASWASWISCFFRFLLAHYKLCWMHCMLSGQQCTDDPIPCRAVMLPCSSPDHAHRNKHCSSPANNGWVCQHHYIPENFTAIILCVPRALIRSWSHPRRTANSITD